MITNKSNKTSQDITNQSQFPDNSSPTTGVIKVCMESLKGILTPEEQKVCEDSNNHFESLLIQFREEVETISNRIGYDYETSSYTQKLGVFDDIKEKELERLFKENPKLKNLFNEIIKKSNIDLETTKNVLMKEGLEDLILENMEEINEKPKTLKILGNLRNLMRDNPKEIGRMIKEGKYTSLDLQLNYLNEIFPNNPEAFINFIKTAGKSGIKSLDLSGNDLNEIFPNNPKAFESFIKTAGKSGMRSLNLGHTRLNKIFPNNPKAFESFIKTAGKSGVRGLDLQLNELNEIFSNNPEIFESFIKTASESGIRSLNLTRNNLRQIFQNNLEALMDILNIMEQGNTRYWDLHNNRIESLLNSNPTLKTQFESKIEELKKKGITVIYNN